MSKKMHIQADIGNNVACLIYKSIKHGAKGKAIEQALLLLAKDKNLKEIFFDDYELERIDDALNGKLEDDSCNTKAIQEEKPKPVKKETPKTQVEAEVKW